jgi:uncharacterized cupin superfamily protein
MAGEPMSLDQIERLQIGRGREFTPPLSDYDQATPNWSETEYRVREDSRAVVATWQGEPGSVQILSWPYDEICVILSGRVAIESIDGGRLEFGAGDAFMVPCGFSGWWHTIETTQKVFVAVSPVPKP